MSIPPLIAYTDRWSVRAGGSIEVKVSCSSANYRADLVRIRSADPNPAGPGMLFDDVPAAFEGSYPGRSQEIHCGSHGVVSLAQPALPQDWTLSVRVQPWLLDGRPQAVLSWIGGKGLSLYATASGAELRVGEAVCRVAASMLERRWYELRVICAGGSLRLLQIPLTMDWGVNGGGEAQLSATADPSTTMVLAAAPVGAGPICRDHLNGRLEHPLLLRGVVDAAKPVETADVPPSKATPHPEIR